MSAGVSKETIDVDGRTDGEGGGLGDTVNIALRSEMDNKTTEYGAFTAVPARNRKHTHTNTECQTGIQQPWLPGNRWWHGGDTHRSSSSP